MRCIARRSFLYVFMGLASFVVWTQGGFAEQVGRPRSLVTAIVYPAESAHIHSSDK